MADVVVAVREVDPVRELSHPAVVACAQGVVAPSKRASDRPWREGLEVTTSLQKPLRFHDRLTPLVLTRFTIE